MKKTLLLILLFISQGVFADEYQEFNQQSKMAIKEFATSLQGSLVAAMQSGGPVEAITVCNQIAPTIASELSKKYGFEVARTSLKVRNPNNSPDAWQTDVLNQFERRKEQGEKVNTLVFSEIITVDNSQEMRLMKAIPTGQVCLTCHGSNIPESVHASLKELYPNDQATGYALGDIRGAFTIRKVSTQ